MIRVFDKKENLAQTALKGFRAAHADRVTAVPHGAVRAALLHNSDRRGFTL